MQIGEGATVPVVGIKNWSLDLSLDTLETTALGSDWKEYITGLKKWTASADGDFNVHTDTNGQKALQYAYFGEKFARAKKLPKLDKILKDIEKSTKQTDSKGDMSLKAMAKEKGIVL